VGIAHRLAAGPVKIVKAFAVRVKLSLTKSQCLGYFATEKEAVRAYDDSARARFGEYAWLNFPER
jgi:hypothetical protein